MPAKVDAGSTPLYRGSNFGSWFTWCVKCNHGGHAGHIREWFAEKRVCPVTGCDCECMASERISQPYQSCHV
jgi:WD repeat-containing protein mio